MKISKYTFTFPLNDTSTLFVILEQFSLSSRVAVIGKNGTAKSTISKLLVEEIQFQE